MTQLESLLPNLAEIRCSTGCPGLDDVLAGGLPSGHFYLLEGEPGSGKTTLSLQFIAEGLSKGEKVLYVTLSESPEDLRTIARTHGIAIEGAQFVDLKPSELD